MRPDKAQRRTPTQLADADLQTEFGRALAPYLAAGEVVAAGTDGAVSHLIGEAAAGRVSIARAERMIGTVAVLGSVGRALYGDRQGQRRLADLRDAGIALEDTLPADRVIPVGQLLRQAVAEFSS